MNSPSAILHSQATSSTPTAVAVPLLAVCLAIVAVRWVAIRRGYEQQEFSIRVTQLMTIALAIAALREGGIQDVVFAGNVAAARLVTHYFVLAGAVVFVLLIRSWVSAKQLSRRSIRILWGLWVVACVWITFCTWPTLSQNIAVEDLENWRTAGYLLVVSTPIPIACVYTLIFVTGALIRGVVPKFWAVVTLIAAFLQMVDHATRGISGLFLSLGMHNWLTQARSTGVDGLFIPAVAALTACGIPSAATYVRRMVGTDTARRQATQLQPLWRAITVAVPEVMLEQRPPSGSWWEIRHRYLVEIEDGLAVLRAHGPAAGSGASAGEQAASLLDGLRAYRAAGLDGADGAMQVDSELPEWVMEAEGAIAVSQEVRRRRAPFPEQMRV